MTFLKVNPIASNTVSIEIYEWKGTEKGHVCVGIFEIQLADDHITLSAVQDWITHHRNDIEVSHYNNEPKFHLQKLGEFSSIIIREIHKELPKTEEKKE